MRHTAFIQNQYGKCDSSHWIPVALWTSLSDEIMESLIKQAEKGRERENEGKKVGTGTRGVENWKRRKRDKDREIER